MMLWWSFINISSRREWFHALISAIIDYQQSARKIVILDDVENIAQWIYAVSLALPPTYRSLLTFTTYHHDPYVSPFMITGTTSDSSFRFGREEYVSYFVINAEANEISTTPVSAFANYVVDNFSERQYENETLEFFDWVEEGRAENPEEISDYLDNLTNFYLATMKMSLPRDSAQTVSGTIGVIRHVVGVGATTDKDVEDLRVAIDILGEYLTQQVQIDHIQLYCDGLRYLKNVDPHVQNTCERACQVLVMFVLKEQHDTLHYLVDVLNKTYSSSHIEQVMNQPDLLLLMSQHLRANDRDQIFTFWKYLGHYLHIEEKRIQNIVKTTFDAMQPTSGFDILVVPTNIQKLMSVVLQMFDKNPGLLLRSAYSLFQTNSNTPVLHWFYYALVNDLTLAERSANYWPYFSEFTGVDLLTYELRRDLLKQSSLGEHIHVVKNLVNLYPDPKDQSQILHYGIEFLQGLTQTKS